MVDALVIDSIGIQSGRSSLTRLALSIIVPTRNEAGNVEALLSCIQDAVNSLPVEVIFVDDSTDHTPAVIESAVGKFPLLHVRMIHREGPERTGGLGGAVVAGLRTAQAEYACVMDGDLQHPPEMVPVLLDKARKENADIVVASRRIESSEVTGLNPARNFISKSLDLVARVFFPGQLRGVSDPLTGFFLVRVNALNLDGLHPKGFKILMEILVRHPHLRKAEIPFHFGERLAGQSKASASEVWKYLSLLWALRFGEGSLRFIGFALVGLSGIFVNSLALYVATDLARIYYLISVVLATVVSTLWNFSLSEALVFRSGKDTQGRLRRFGLFFVMNSLALGLRGPIVYLLTSVLGVYYLISNLVSLAVLTVLRFLLADNVIWKQPETAPSTQKIDTTQGGYSMNMAYNYNIHNIITVASEGELPELEPFFVEETIGRPTIQVRIGTPRPMTEEDKKTGCYLNYHEIFGHLGFEVGITFSDPVDVVASPSLRLSPHVLYTNVVEPILRWTFVKMGYALVHGATIAFGKDAYLITARTDTGKTTTLLKILARQRRNEDRAAFLSDDMTIISPDGIALTYPKPLTISAHTLRAVNSKTLSFKERFWLPFQSRVHSREGRKFAFVISQSKMPAATINLFVQMVIPPPKYFVEKLVPRVKRTQIAKFAGMFVIERGDQGQRKLANREAIEILLRNCEDAYGFPPYEALKSFLYFHNGVDLREKEKEIILQALGELPTTSVSSKNLDWWCRIPPLVDEQYEKEGWCVDRAHSAVSSLRLNPVEGSD